ncbi:phosphatidylinositol N-acetylglucosaminyltransferase [Saitoella complicata NRRL Y-17804]|nr:phosphatidylinositol N-acetylglucosaminyltransferase [Saitoella complicata NRRL Y-17804]ODQ53563.1 phosphatidylinositol N-acetylglucosaminyltransferase [Saitoella complicata NRRL Y-17804]
MSSGARLAPPTILHRTASGTDTSPPRDRLLYAPPSDEFIPRGRLPSRGSSSFQRPNFNFCSPRRPPPQGTDPGDAVRKPWRKLLWIKQDYPDNFTHHTFLHSLQRNVSVRPYDFWPLVNESTVITQHLSSIIIFAAAFVAIYTDLVRAGSIATLGTVGTILGYGYLDWKLKPQQDNPYRRKRTRTQTAKSSLLIFFTLLGLSPILTSLTKSTTSDSIWALSTWLFLANLLFHDYASSPPSTGKMDAALDLRFPGSLGTNAGVMGSVVLASRLRTTDAVFSLMLWAVEWFALFPIFRRYVRFLSPTLHHALTISLLALALFSLYYVVSIYLSLLFLLLVGFITFVCPLWLINLQKYKNEIRGPWDVARPKLKEGRSPPPEAAAATRAG